MKSKVSAMMDGELEQREVDEIIATLKKEEGVQKEWDTYHLIGDALRQSANLSTNISRRVSTQLHSEPTILAPSTKPFNPTKHTKKRVFAFSIAASIVAMATAWLGLQYQLEPQQMLVADRANLENNIPMQPVMVSTQPSMVYQHPPAEINDYLFVHREFSPGTVTNGQTVFIHPAVESHKPYSNYREALRP